MPKIIQEPKKLIKEAAREELTEKGIEGFNMRGIAKRCSLGVGTLYHYYPDKLSLLTDLLNEDWNQKVEEAKKKISSSSSLEEDIHILLDTIQDFRQQNEDIFQSYKTDEIPSFFLKLHPLFLGSILTLWKTVEEKEKFETDNEMSTIIAELIILSSRHPDFSTETLTNTIHKLVY